MAASITSNQNRNQNMIFQKFICGCKECLSRCEVAHDAKTYGQIDGHGQKKTFQKKNFFCAKYVYKFQKTLNITKLLVSGQNPESSDCLLRSIEQKIT